MFTACSTVNMAVVGMATGMVTMWLFAHKHHALLRPVVESCSGDGEDQYGNACRCLRYLIRVGHHYRGALIAHGWSIRLQGVKQRYKKKTLQVHNRSPDL